MSVIARVTFYDGRGCPVGMSSQFFLPEKLDWMPIDVKVFWFLDRGYGEPDATHVLFVSQGEQRLITLGSPLSYNRETLKEREHGYEERIEQFITESGFCRTPRNQ